MKVEDSVRGMLERVVERGERDERLVLPPGDSGGPPIPIPIPIPIPMPIPMPIPISP